ncbi:putative Thaumatin family [Helianthus annuus]|nr:putative Thaumatin family [Helianthus annuus]KAJ0541462.1 putative Thaumatin family [Helianthus annuus]KAJ0706539.1 putative Thaumatin family [Helianthus annuus]KAJ0710577.1 putative Thaumatin family [Helianthus annuus]KAJ0887104.1 putative Thaumatin family [Helianthus annuus]
MIMTMGPLTSTSMHVIFFLWTWLLFSGNILSDGARVFTIINDCDETIWPAITPGESFGGGGYMLRAKESRVHTAPVSWSGRIWGRTNCKFDSNGNGTCLTGRCGSSLQCSASGETPATLAEFTLTTLNFYDVSLVDGFNLPMSVRPVNGKGNCSVAGCVGDLRKNCPKELSVKAGGKVAACRSACDVFNTDEYCCRGNYGNSATCKPTYYSKKFKDACPTSYSYAYDDPTSIFTCSEADYTITFCGSKNRTQCSYYNNKLHCSGSTMVFMKNFTWSLMMVLVVVCLSILL